MSAVHIRPYRPGDEQGICELFKICHGRDLSLDVWKWRYMQGGIPAIIDVGESNGRIVAHLGVLPQNLGRGEAAKTGGLWVDLMVHPDFRNLTLFLEMAEANRDRSARGGVEVLYAFPNDRSYPVLKRMMDWQAIEEIDALEAPLAGVRRIVLRGADDLRVKRVLDFDKVFDEFWKKVRPANAWSVRRDSRWLSWRYGGRPGGGYGVWAVERLDGRFEGWLAAKIFKGPDGVIGDILDFWSEPAAAEVLWNAAIEFFTKGGVKTVSAWALKGGALSTAYQKWGLEDGGPRTHFAGRWATNDAAAPFPAKGLDWAVSKGDSDVF